MSIKQQPIPEVYGLGQLEAEAGVKLPEPLTDEHGRPTREGWRKISEYFQKPMEHKALEFTSGPRAGQVYWYVTARQVAERLDKVIGAGNWGTYFTIIDRDRHVVQCVLTLFSHVSRADVGYPNTEGSQYETEPFKAAYSDAFKRAAVQFGIGRYLYGD